MKPDNMKHTISLRLIASIVVFLTSCKKDSAHSNSILGKWNIVTDSTFEGVGVNNHPVNYTGKTGDYFDVRTDGNIYIKEGITLDTLSYKLTSDTTILITRFGIIANGVPELSHIINLTAHSVTINAPTAVTPGGLFGRKVNLTK